MKARIYVCTHSVYGNVGMASARKVRLLGEETQLRLTERAQGLTFGKFTSIGCNGDVSLQSLGKILCAEFDSLEAILEVLSCGNMEEISSDGILPRVVLGNESWDENKPLVHELPPSTSEHDIEYFFYYETWMFRLKGERQWKIVEFKRNKKKQTPKGKKRA